jgi:hypothetical protein
MDEPPESPNRWAHAATALTMRCQSFFATLKKELIHRLSWPSKAELRTEVFEYIEMFFHRRRRHSALGQVSPQQFEINTSTKTEKVATTAAVAA